MRFTSLLTIISSNLLTLLGKAGFSPIGKDTLSSFVEEDVALGDLEKSLHSKLSDHYVYGGGGNILSLSRGSKICYRVVILQSGYRLEIVIDDGPNAFVKIGEKILFNDLDDLCEEIRSRGELEQ